jgi:hypothetical protein
MFVDTLRENHLTRAMVEEGSGSQPLYPVEILHDDQGKSYLADGWMRFIDDYDLKVGWSSSSPVAPGRLSSASASSTPPAAPTPTPPGREWRAPPNLLP